MTMPNNQFKIKWVEKYSVKPFITKETLNWYKWCQKIGRREYLKRSREKTARFARKHPGNNHWRVFKATILNEMKLDAKTINRLKRKVERNQSVKGLRKELE